MKNVRIILCAISLSVLGIISCKAQEQNNSLLVQSETKSENRPLIMPINAKYMRKHIWDYKNDTKFVFKGKRPVVIDFYADWCGPCRQLSPKLERLAKKYKGQIDFYKVNTDDEGELARVFGVRALPTLSFIPVEGTPIQTVGNISMGQLEEVISKIK